MQLSFLRQQQRKGYKQRVKMISIFNKKDTAGKLIVDPDAEFRTLFKIDAIIKNNTEMQDVLRQIDGVTEYNGGFLKTKYGVTSIQNISTGSKAAILLMMNPDKVVNDFELGNNIKELMRQQTRNYNIKFNGIAWKLNENDSMIVDDKQVTGRMNILKALGIE